MKNENMIFREFDTKFHLDIVKGVINIKRVKKKLIKKHKRKLFIKDALCGIFLSIISIIILFVFYSMILINPKYMV